MSLISATGQPRLQWLSENFTQEVKPASVTMRTPPQSNVDRSKTVGLALQTRYDSWQEIAGLFTLRVGITCSD